MRIKKNRLIFMLTLCIVPMLRVYANSIFLECPKEINSGSEFVCRLGGETESKITAIGAEFVNFNVEVLEFFPNSKNWNGDGKIKSVQLYGKGVTDKFDIGMIKFKHTGTEKINVGMSSVFYYDKNGKGYSVDSINQEIMIKGSDDNANENENEKVINKDTSQALDDLKIENHELKFEKDKFDYELNIKDDTKLNIIPSLKEDTLYEIEGNDNLTDGSIIKVDIISNGDKVNEYNIKIKKGNNNTYRIVFIVIIVILVIINVINFIRKGGKHEKSKKKNS